MTLSADETLDSLEALCHQESTGYQVHDYLCEAAREGSSFGPLHADTSSRSSMVQWCNNLVDFCKYDRETTAYAVSCLDRFLSTPDGFQLLFDSEQFQLAAMCALYTTAKIHERQALEPASIAKLSRGLHTAEAVEAMERRMLKALQWRVNPPTAMRFVHLFLDLIPTHMLDDASKQVMLELVKYQVKLALLDYQLSQHRSSNLALAAVLNAIDSQQHADLSFSLLVQSRIGGVLPMCTDALLLDIRCALCRQIASQSTSEPMSAVLMSKLSTATIFSSHPTTTIIKGGFGHHHEGFFFTSSSSPTTGSPRIVSYDMMI